MPVMSESEAKDKWCPFVRVRFADKGPAGNTFPDDPLAEMTAACIATSCMAWRWGNLDNDPSPDPRGYCGLAGRP